jgi:hypothetical protein
MVFSRFLVAAALGVALLSPTASAEDFVKTIKKPVWKGYALDWCLNWGEGCGQAAADKYCKSGGYEKAVNFSKWEDLGKPTRLIGSNQVCDEEFCDSFKHITCQKADYDDDEEEQVQIKRYNKPLVGKRRLDWCRDWGQNCGQPAADYYCQSEGHTKAAAYEKADNLWKTRLLKSGQKCDGENCAGFAYIDCK